MILQILLKQNVIIRSEKKPYFIQKKDEIILFKKFLPFRWETSQKGKPSLDDAVAPLVTYRSWVRVFGEIQGEAAYGIQPILHLPVRAGSTSGTG